MWLRPAAVAPQPSVPPAMTLTQTPGGRTAHPHHSGRGGTPPHTHRQALWLRGSRNRPPGGAAWHVPTNRILRKQNSWGLSLPLPHGTGGLRGPELLLGAPLMPSAQDGRCVPATLSWRSAPPGPGPPASKSRAQHGWDRPCVRRWAGRAGAGHGHAPLGPPARPAASPAAAGTLGFADVLAPKARSAGVPAPNVSTTASLPWPQDPGAAWRQAAPCLACTLESWGAEPLPAPFGTE